MRTSNWRARREPDLCFREPQSRASRRSRMSGALSRYPHRRARAVHSCPAACGSASWPASYAPRIDECAKHGGRNHTEVNAATSRVWSYSLHGVSADRTIYRDASAHVRTRLRTRFRTAGLTGAGLAVAFAGLLGPAPARALATFEDALVLYQRGSHAVAYPAFEELANRGDQRAQFILGLMLMDGDGVAADRVRRYSWLQIAAQGYYGAYGNSRE